MADDRPGAGPGASPGPAGRWAVPGLLLAMACFGLARFSFGFFVPAVRTSLDLDVSRVGAIGSLSFLGYLAAILASWALTERFGARWVAIGAGGTAATGFALVAALPGLPGLSIGLLIAGMSAALLLPPMVATATRWSHGPRHDALAITVSAATALGVALTGPIALLGASRWRPGFAALAAVTIGVTAWFARRFPGEADRRSRRLPDDVTTFVDKPPRAMRLVIAASALGVASSAVWVFGRDTAERHIGLSPTASGALWVLIGAAGGFAVVTNTLTRRFGRPGAWSLSMGVLALSTALLGTASHRGSLAFMAAPAFGASYLILTVLLLHWGARLSPDEPLVGLRFALLILVLAHTAGALLVGEFLEVSEPDTVFMTMAAVAAAGAAIRPHGQPGVEA